MEFDPVLMSSPVPKKRTGISDFIKGMSAEAKIEFCNTKKPLHHDCEITYEIFDILIKIAAECAENRNIGVSCMIANLNSSIEIPNISNLVKKFNKYVLKHGNDRIAMKQLIICEKPNPLYMFDIDKMDIGEIVLNGKEFQFTNSVFIQLCKLKNTNKKLTWHEICHFLQQHLKLNYLPLESNICRFSKSLNNKINDLASKKKTVERELLLKELIHFDVNRSSEADSIADSGGAENEYTLMCERKVLMYEQEISKLDKSVLALTTQCKGLSEENAISELERQKITSRYNKLEKEVYTLKQKFNSKVEEKNNLISHLNARNVGKREKRKLEKIKMLEKKSSDFEEKINSLQEQCAHYKYRYDCERKKVGYYSSKLKEQINNTNEDLNIWKTNIQYYENLTEELKEKVRAFDEEQIETFMDGRYTNEVRQVYYELLRRNVSVASCGDIIKIVLENLAKRSVGCLPKKSLAATMMVEAEAISKMQVREALLTSENNILHTDGTRYRFKEIGSYQVNTSSGAYTLGIEEMFSGEASSYVATFRELLHELSTFVVPEKEHDEDVARMLVNFKGLMTDRCAVNGCFFDEFKKWRTEIIPFVVKNYDSMPQNEKETITRMHHVFCGLHVLHNMGLYAEKAIKEWEKVVLEDASIHSGFQKGNSRSYDLLFELSKLTSVAHGDQRSGKAAEWHSYLNKIDEKNYMTSFLHHRFNIFFVLGGSAYFHRNHLRDFVNHLNHGNFLHESIKSDIESTVYIAAFRALGIMNKMVAGPLFRKVEEVGHIFDLNDVWVSLNEKLRDYSKDASVLIAGNSLFDESLLTKDDVYRELFNDTGSLLLDALTQECLELICCTCSLMVSNQLRDQLPGGLYHNPTSQVRSETANCLRTNVLSERDFAQFDRRLSMKPTMSTVAACGVIMYANNKTSEWLSDKSEGELDHIIRIAISNKGNIIKKYKERKANIMRYRLDMLERKKMETEVKRQKQDDEKAEISKSLQTYGGLWTSVADMETNLAVISVTSHLQALKCQIAFRKKVLCQKFESKKLLQLGESVDGKYSSFTVDTLKSNLKAIFTIATYPAEERASTCMMQKIRSNMERKSLLEERKG